MHTISPPPRRGYRPHLIAVAMLAVIGAFFLLREHWGHLLGWWPYLLLLACPLMHLLHGHAHDTTGEQHEGDKP